MEITRNCQFPSQRDSGIERHSVATQDHGLGDINLRDSVDHSLRADDAAENHFFARIAALSEQADFAQRTAFAAMSSMGEMGAVLQFLRASAGCDTLDRLVELIFEALRQYELHGLVASRLVSGRQCFSSRGPCTPLEDSILLHASGMGRVFQFHDRLVINYSDLTLLVSELPLGDPDRVGRLRDHLAILVEGASARVEAIEIERQLRAAQADAIVELTGTLADIERNQAHSRLRATEINTDYLRELTSVFVSLGLSEEQETTLAELARKAHAQLYALRDDEFMIGDRLRAVTGRLRVLT